MWKYNYSGPNGNSIKISKKNSPTQLKNREAYKKVTPIFMLFFLFIADITTINQQNTPCSSL